MSVRLYNNGNVTPVAAGQSQRFSSGVGVFNWHYLSSPPQIPQGPGVHLELGGLIYGIVMHTCIINNKQFKISSAGNPQSAHPALACNVCKVVYSDTPAVSRPGAMATPRRQTRIAGGLPPRFTNK